MAKLLFVSHRYPPYPGGTEYFVQQMAEECLARGHEVTVFTNYDGHLNGVKVTTVTPDASDYDLIVVHGSDVPHQDYIHNHAVTYGDKTLYMIIKPSDSTASLTGMRFHNYVGWSTTFDYDHAIKCGVAPDKLFRVRHGISVKDRTRGDGDRFKRFVHINTSRIFLSAGGFSPHKSMRELVDIFKRAEIPDTTLVVMGYMHGDVPDASDNVVVLLGLEEHAMADALAAADLYVMNSREEGYGLVLLEAMLNGVPWIARDIAGAHDLNIMGYGTTYNTAEELERLLKEFDPANVDVSSARQFALENHTIKNTVDDIEKVIRRVTRN